MNNLNLLSHSPNRAHNSRIVEIAGELRVLRGSGRDKGEATANGAFLYQFLQ